MTSFQGTGVALVTPFTPTSAVDVPALKRLTQHLVQGGVEFLVVLGTTGESATLEKAEKDLVISTVIEANAGRLPIVLGCGGNNTAEVCREIADLTARYAPAGFLSVSPYYNKPVQTGIVEHFKQVCGSTHLPVILYNVPGRTSSNMLPQTVLAIADACPNAVAVKEASGSIEQGMAILLGLRQRGRTNFAVLSGDDHLAVPEIAMGYRGVITVAANAVPKQYSDMIRAALAGDFAKANDLQYRLLTLMMAHFDEGNPAGIKASLEHLGICGRATRLPLMPASDGLKAKLAAELHQLPS
jgi:4-hydroxy-tetrahydrodipicolinate synthase